MSKKNYFEPEMEVIEIKMSQMLCASDPKDDGETKIDDGEGGEDDF
jgi:hypothetical protein